MSTLHTLSTATCLSIALCFRDTVRACRWNTAMPRTSYRRAMLAAAASINVHNTLWSCTHHLQDKK